jgi:hypothetical protein
MSFWENVTVKKRVLKSGIYILVYLVYLVCTWYPSIPVYIYIYIPGIICTWYLGILVVSIVVVDININIITMPGSSPHVRAKSKMKKDARQSLADSGRNIQAKDRLARFIPHTVIPRGRHSHNQVSKFRGKGISKNPIPDAMMKKHLDKKCFLVNNVRLKLNSTEKLSRCPHCYVGPNKKLKQPGKTSSLPSCQP